MKKEKKSGAVRVASLEVSGLTKDDYKRWRDLMDVCRGIVNATWQAWLVWHVANRSEEKLKEHFARFNEWKAADQATRGEKPKWPVVAVPPACAKATYDEVSRRFPEISTDCRELCRNSVIQKIGNTKAANGSLPGWVAILFCRQSIPSTVRANPIPFSKKNAEIEPPAEKDGQWKLHVRFTRVPVEGKKTGKTILETVNLWSKGRKAAGQVAILKKIAAGEYDFIGSNMIYSESKRKWLAAICYRAPIEPAKSLDKDRKAFLRPAPIDAVWQHPWKLRMPGANRSPGGRGEYIASVRRKVMAERISRQKGYTFAGHSNKGHGRNRALAPIWQLQQRWKDFVKTANYQVAKDVVQQCIDRNCGTLVYFQPGGSVRDSRFLSCAGKRDDVREASAWDYYQMGSRLELLCKEAGIVFVWKKPETGCPAGASGEEIVAEKPAKKADRSKQSTQRAGGKRIAKQAVGVDK